MHLEECCDNGRPDAVCTLSLRVKFLAEDVQYLHISKLKFSVARDTVRVKISRGIDKPGHVMM